MKTALIGYTGFVGQNLLKTMDFDDLFNSENYLDIKGKTYDLVVCSGIPANMWLANNYPEKDFENIKNLLDAIKTATVKKFVLISSVAVYKQPVDKFDENSLEFEDKLAYGKNRRFAEQFVIDNFEDYHILRLPALFADGLKKNFIYDILNQEPAFMPENKFIALIDKLTEEERNLLNSYYAKNKEKGVFEFEKEEATKDKKRKDVLNLLVSNGITALNFTNPESVFQFYNVDNLSNDIEKAIENGIKVLNICSTPTSAREILKETTGKDFINNNSQNPLFYDMRSLYTNLWNQGGAYLYSKEQVLSELKNFISKSV